MGDFEFPTNIKQIGSIGDGLRIYMEDYVCSYLQQYAEAAGYEERLALLIGRDLIIDNQNVLFISGAVQGKYTHLEDGILNFTEKSWDYAHDQMDKYFEGMEIVGWLQSQPGYGVSLNTSYAQYHIENFILPYQALFVMDPMEKLNVFYVWDEKSRELVETKGYFVYYDKNRNMHNYMLDNKIVKFKLATQDYLPKYEDEPEPEPEKEDIPVRTTKANKPSAHPQLRRPARRSYPGSKRTFNMLATLSAVLFLICFIMGAGLVQNDGRISSLEKQLSLLSASYSNVVAQIRQDNAESVFASSEKQSQITLEPQNAPQPTVIQEDGNLALLQDNTIVEPVPIPVPSSTPVPAPSPEPEAAIPPEEPQSTQTVNEPPRTAPLTYVVQQGDNLISISRKFYGTADMVDKIMELNRLEDSDKIYFGKTLELP